MRQGQGKAGAKPRRAPLPGEAEAHDGARSGPALRAAVAPFIAMEVLSRAGVIEAGGGSVVHMELGEPGRPRPARRARPPSGPSTRGGSATRLPSVS